MQETRVFNNFILTNQWSECWRVDAWRVLSRSHWLLSSSSSSRYYCGIGAIILFLFQLSRPRWLFYRLMTLTDAYCYYSDNERKQVSGITYFSPVNYHQIEGLKSKKPTSGWCASPIKGKIPSQVCNPLTLTHQWHHRSLFLLNCGCMDIVEGLLGGVFKNVRFWGSWGSSGGT